MKKILGLSLVIAVLAVMLTPGLAGAHFVPHGCTFQGTVKVDGRWVPDGTEVIPWVPDVAPEIYERWGTETYTDAEGVSRFICQVIIDNHETDEKDGAYLSDTIRFDIRLGVANLTADQSVNFGWAMSGSNRMYGLGLTATYMPPPDLLSPPDGTKVQAIEVTFDWSDVTATGVNYSLQVDNASDFSSPVIDEEGLSDSNYTVSFVSGPLAAGTYYWRAEAVDGGGWHSGWSEVWSFTAPDIGEENLVSGWNLITYKGDTLPTEIAIASLGDHLVVIWGRDNGSGTWHGYAPGGGFANDLLELKQYEPYWVYVNQAIVLHYIIDP